MPPWRMRWRSHTGAKLHILTVLVNLSAYATPDVMGGVEVVVEIIERQGQDLLALAKAREAGVGVESKCR